MTHINILVHLSVREVKQRMFQANPKFEGRIGFFFSRNGYVLRYPAFKALESHTPPAHLDNRFSFSLNAGVGDHSTVLNADTERLRSNCGN